MTADLTAFLEQFRPGGYTTYVAILPNGDTIAETFNGTDPHHAERWIRKQNRDHRGIYYTVNATPAGLRRKPAKADITSIDGVWSDVDPLDGNGRSWSEERERLEALADELHALPWPPTFIVDSGNGIQPNWLLADPIEANDEYRQAAESLCSQIEAVLGAKGTHNVDRLLRCPGTRNYPNEKKRKLGRGETESRIMRWTWRRYSWTELEQLAEHLRCNPLRHAVPCEPPRPRVSLGDVALPGGAPEPLEAERVEELRARYPDVFDLARYDGDQSRQDLALASLARRLGWSQQDAWRLIIALRGDRKALRRDYVDRTLARAYAEQPAEDGSDHTAVATSDDWEAPLLEAIDELNAEHFVVKIGGQTVVATIAQDEALKRELLVFSQERDIRLYYKHRHYLTGHTAKGTPIWKGLGEAWLEHRNRRTFKRIALVPKGQVPAGTFNLWRGFGVEPQPGKWPLIRRHLLEVICAGNESDCRWLVRWMARAVQYPESHAEVAVVLRGPKGTGKGTLGQILHRIFRHHALQISNPVHFTGRFNGHLVDVLFLFVDEAFWAGDKSGEGTLKGLVTEPTIPIEPKFVNLFQAINRLKILMASNADWVVPATHDERRYFVLDVSDCRHCDREYFDRLYAAIDGAELPAFLEYLMQLDLSDFDHRNPPHTAALNAQKLAGGDSLTKFWLDCLTSGEIIGTGESEWPEDVVKQTLHDAYVSHAHDHGDRHPLSNAILAKKLAELMPGRVLRSGRPMKPAGDILRPHRYILPTLDECRTAFLKAMSINQYAWPEEQADDV